jgi:uncharacterized protein YndB with AHSA1/START domain
MSHKITVSALVQAPKSKVWDSYTNPAHIINWNFADPSWHCPKAENDMTVGGIYNARMEAKDGSFGFDFLATYTEVEPEDHFTYEFGGRFATVRMESQEENTEIQIVFDAEEENPVEMQQAGWQMILNNFKSYTEQL